MEDKQLTNQESLDLIRKMINQTRVKVQSNQAELWIGCLGIFVSISIYVSFLLTHSPLVHYLWFLMFASYFISTYFKKKEIASETYLSSAINKGYTVMGWTFFIACLAIFIQTFYYMISAFIVLFPISLILMSFVNLFKGLVLKEKAYIYPAYIVMFMGFFTLNYILVFQKFLPHWTLGYAVASFLLYVLPYLILNRKQQSSR